MWLKAELRIPSARVLSVVAVSLIALSVVLGIASTYPTITGNMQTSTIIDDSFTLTRGTVYRQGLGTFRGGENITILVDSPHPFLKTSPL